MSGLAPTISVPAKEKIDFSSSKEVIRYAMQLCLASREASRLIPDGNLSSITRIRRASRQWLEKVEENLPGYLPGDALEVIVAYDFIHRLAYSAPPMPDLPDRYILRAFESMLHGDKGVSKTTLFRQLSGGIRRKSPLYLSRPLKWQSVQLARWHKEIKEEIGEGYKEGNKEGIQSFYESHDICQRIDIISILLETDLFPFEGSNESAFKQALFLRHRHLLENAKESHESGSRSGMLSLLRSLEHFLFRSIPYLPEEEYLQYKNEIENTIREEYEKI